MNRSGNLFNKSTVVRKKMYKSGKSWVVAASIFSAMTFFPGSLIANADQSTNNTNAVQTDENQKNDQSVLDSTKLSNADQSNGNPSTDNKDSINKQNQQKQDKDPQTNNDQVEQQSGGSKKDNNNNSTSNPDIDNKTTVVKEAAKTDQTASIDDQNDPFKNILDGNWKIDQNKIFYQRQDGSLLKGLHTVRGNLQYFDPSSGQQIKGQFEEVNNVKYYFDNNTGNAVSYAQVDSNGTVSGFDSKGQQQLKNVFATDPVTKKTYYFNASGQSSAYVQNSISFGKQVIIGFDAFGNVLKSGFADDQQGNTYYFDANGNSVTGFQTIDKNNYFFDPTGHLKKNYSVSINGQWYYFNGQTGIGKSSIQYQVESGLTNQVDNFNKHNQAKNYTTQNFENVNGFLTADSWYKPKDIYQNGKEWVANDTDQLRPILMAWWPNKKIQVDYLNFMQKQGLYGSQRTFSGQDSQDSLNKAAEQVQIAIESRTSEVKDMQWLRTLISAFIKTEPGWNSSSENIDYSGDQFQGGFLAYENNAESTPWADSSYRKLNLAPFDWQGNNSYSGSEFLLANDVDNSNPIVQAEQLNWLHYLMNFGSIVKNDPQANFDGIRIDAVDNVDADLLKIASDYFKDAYDTDKSEANANKHISILEDWSGADPKVISDLGNPQLTMDNGLHSDLLSSLTKPDGQRSSLDTLIKSLVDRSNDFQENDVIPNYSFVRAHDSEVQAMLGQIITDTTGAPSGNSFTWEQLNEALKVYYADYASTDKKYTHYNIPSAYAILLTDKNVVPRVYYGDIFTDGGQYMSQKSINYDAITALLKARVKYVSGGQRMSVEKNGILTSVRYGKDGSNKNEGIGLIVSNNPNLRLNNNDKVVLSMGKEHANQQYRALLLTKEYQEGDKDNGIEVFQDDNNAPTVSTDSNGDLTFTSSLINGQKYTNIEGYSSPLVSGYLAAWVPVGAADDQDVRTASKDVKSPNNSVFDSNDSLDSNVIYEGFSNFQSMPTDPSEYTNSLIAKNVDLFKSWGITSFELAPQYRSSSDKTFLDSVIDNGYAFTDRYDLGFGTPTKYGTVDDLADAIKALHSKGIQAIADWVTNQIYNLPGKEAVTVSRVDDKGNVFPNAEIKNDVYIANTIGGGDYQKKYGGAFLDQLKNDPKFSNLFSEKQISTGQPIDPSQKITEWSAKFFNGTNVLGRGSDYVLKDESSGNYFKVSSTNEIFLPLQLIGKDSKTGFYSDDQGNISFYSTSGYKAKNTFIQDGLGDWYYFDASGNMQKGTVDGMSGLMSLNISSNDSDQNNNNENSQYFVLPNGAFEKDGFAQDIDGNDYYFDKTGKMLKNTYLADSKQSDVFYYLDSQGKMARGLMNINGHMQFFLNDGSQLKDAYVYDIHTQTLYKLSKDDGNATDITKVKDPSEITAKYLTFDSSKQYKGDYAKIIYSIEPNIKRAFINEKGRNDGVFTDGPALSSESTLQFDPKAASSYNGSEVNVIQFSITQRSNGTFYTYAKVQLANNADKIFWIDTRALSTNKNQQNDYASIISYDLHSYQGSINNRDDGIYEYGPALTNYDSLTENYRTSSKNSPISAGQAVTVLESLTTKRSNGKKYIYSKIKVGNKIFWIDQRAIDPMADIQSTQAANDQYAYIDAHTRNDGIFTSGPALTSLDTQKPAAYSADSKANYDGKLVQILELSTTKRSNGKVYVYAKVQASLDNNDVFWIDYRAVNLQKHHLVADYSTSEGSGSAIIQTNGRADLIYKNGPALTSSNTIFSDGKAADLNGHQVKILKVATTTRDDGKAYTYYYLQDGNDNYWLDRRSVSIIDEIIKKDTDIVNNYNQFAIINGMRHDGIYQYGPALTSENTQTKNSKVDSFDYRGALVKIIEVDSTRRASNQNIYQYAHVQLADTSNNSNKNILRDFWIDLRSLIYDKISDAPKSNLGNFEIDQSNRSDKIYSDLPYTSEQSFNPTGDGKSFNGKKVDLLQQVSVKRFPDSNLNYVYSLVELKDGTNRQFWIDDRALKQL